MGKIIIDERYIGTINKSIKKYFKKHQKLPKIEMRYSFKMSGDEDESSGITEVYFMFDNGLI